MLDAFAGAATRLPPPSMDLARSALFLDIDGTLLDFAARPEDVTADAALCALLKSLARRTSGAIGILTGRSLADADRVLGGSVDVVAALHGQHCRVGNQLLRQGPPAPNWLQAKNILRHIVDCGAIDVDVEDKGSAVALHYRAKPEQGPLAACVVNEIAAGHGLRAIHGRCVSEMMPVGATKGTAVSTLMRLPPFAGRIPVVLGDDVTDEDGFAAANALGGLSILVGERRGTQARLRLKDVPAVRHWLGAL